MDRELGNKEGNRTGFTFKTLEEGTATHVYAAFDREIIKVNGAYLLDAHVAPPDEIKPYAIDRNEAEKLWELSEDIVGEKFAI